MSLSLCLSLISLVPYAQRNVVKIWRSRKKIKNGLGCRLPIEGGFKPTFRQTFIWCSMQKWEDQSILENFIIGFWYILWILILKDLLVITLRMRNWKSLFLTFSSVECELFGASFLKFLFFLFVCFLINWDLVFCKLKIKFESN